MARFTLNTHDVGPLEFFVPDAGGHVRLESGSNVGTLGRQICEGGGFQGETLRATPQTLPIVARKWNHQRRLAAIA